MREKYVEERFPRYFVFGEHADGRVDVASADKDTLATGRRSLYPVLVRPALKRSSRPARGGGLQAACIRQDTRPFYSWPRLERGYREL